VIAYASEAARLAFLFNDIERSMWAFVCYSVFTGIFIHGGFAFHDGRLSIRRGFLPGEVEEFISLNFPASEILFYRTFPSRIVIAGASLNESFYEVFA
jgi:hypothetical protein